jgi:hypothetical protein
MDKTLDKVGLKSSKTSTDDKKLVKQATKQEGRDPKTGQILPGFTGNKNGRPPSGLTIIDQFRDNPKVNSVIEKLFQVADTLGSDKPDKDALSASKLIIERIIPSLKASELKLTDDDDGKGFVLLPSQETPNKE